MHVDTSSETPAHSFQKPLTIIAMILGAMAVGSAIVCLVALAPSLKLLGFCVAFLMMMFIGMPLVLASMADARESH